MDLIFDIQAKIGKFVIGDKQNKTNRWYDIIDYVKIRTNTIEKILFPYLQIKLEGQENNKEIINNFKIKFANIQDFIEKYFSTKNHLSIEYFLNIHKLLYNSIDNLGMINLKGETYKISPGTFRKQEFEKNDECILTSKVFDIEKDLEEVILNYNKIQFKQRTDILELYCKIIKIHPFDDANGRTGGTICDIECIRYGLKPLNFLNIRQKNKAYLIYLVGLYHYTKIDNKLDLILDKIDKFNENITEKASSRNSFLTKNTPGFKRKLLFSKIDEGIELDSDGLNNTISEELGIKLGKNINGNVILDCFGGIGGVSIAFALTGKNVISIESDYERYLMAKNNAKIYGVENNINFINGDIFNVFDKLNFDVVYIDIINNPFIKESKIKFDDFDSYTLKLFEVLSRKTNKFVLTLPLYFDLNKLSKIDGKISAELFYILDEPIFYNVYIELNNNIFNNDILFSDNYYDVIKKTLISKFNYISNGKNPNDFINLKNGFYSHCKIISDYIQKNENKLENLDIVFFVQLHKLFYQAGFQIKAVGNDGVEYIMFPGEFRKQYLAKYITDFSKTLDIEVDFQKIIEDFNNINKTRKNIFKFYIDFGKVHPFGDSNGTISALIIDILCFKYGFKELNLLNIRFKDKNTLFKIIEIYEIEKYLEKILNLIDDFNKNN